MNSYDNTEHQRIASGFILTMSIFWLDSNANRSKGVTNIVYVAATHKQVHSGSCLIRAPLP